VLRRPASLQFVLRPRIKLGHCANLAALWLILLAVLQSGGCRKSEEGQLTPAQIHQITRHLASPASAATPSGTTVKLRQSAASGSSSSTGYVRIVFKNAQPSDANRSAVAKLLQSLNAAAIRDHLTQDPPTQNGELLQFTLRHEGVPALEVEIVTRTPAAPNAAATDLAGNQGSTKLAVIIDDLGSDRSAAETVFSLGYPLTVSVLPNHDHSVDIAQEAHRRGLQVMLHLPMQSVANETPEVQELHPGMPAQEVAGLVEQFLQSVPDVSGVNNHQGSQATADGALMDELMPVLRDHHLFYIDSRTTAATVAYEAAQDFGVRSAFRNVPFLDDVAEVAAVRKQMQLAFRGAREKGEAIAIGHPHPATLQALRELLPQAQAQGIQLVLASELVH